MEVLSDLYDIKELKKLFNKYNVKDLQNKNGQSECYFCKNIRHCYSLTWTSFLYEYKEHYYCFHCLLLILLLKENQKLKDLIDTILNFSFFKEECPLNFGFENNTNEDKSQSIFYEDEWCENNCNDNYKDCWLKYFKKLQELEGSEK